MKIAIVTNLVTTKITSAAVQKCLVSRGSQVCLCLCGGCVFSYVQLESLAYVFHQLLWTCYRCLTSLTMQSWRDRQYPTTSDISHTHKSQPNLCFQGDTGLAGRRDAIVNSGDRVVKCYKSVRDLCGAWDSPSVSL